MNKKRSVFLFGAGASLSWGAPKTWDLTQIIRKSGFKTTNNKTTITEYIYQELILNGFQEENINFETILNVIEELIVFYSQDSKYNSPSIFNCFFTSKVENQIFNYSVKGDVIKHGYTLEIPKGNDYPYSERAYYNEHPHQFFLMHLMQELISVITSEVINYSYHSPNHSKINFDNTISEQFSSWMAHLAKRNILRLYTLNYDRVFKVLMERKGLKVFEGFDSSEYIPHGNYYRALIPEILNDSESNVHYNLHGSINWIVKSEDEQGLPNPEIFLTSGGDLPINERPSIQQIEKGKATLLSSIITGYHKLLKTNLSPFRQMYSTFDRDCNIADVIYIVGYSLGDEHINQVIKTAIQYNSNAELKIIDPYFLSNKLDHELYLKFIPYADSVIGPPNSISKNEHSFLNGRVKVHTMTFQDFIASEIN